jgi:hypothetical protein
VQAPDHAIDPLAVARHRERHQESGPKSDAADAEVATELIRTDRLNHAPYRRT